jgi:hypothetical protein
LVDFSLFEEMMFGKNKQRHIPRFVLRTERGLEASYLLTRMTRHHKKMGRLVSVDK